MPVSPHSEHSLFIHAFTLFSNNSRVSCVFLSINASGVLSVFILLRIIDCFFDMSLKLRMTNAVFSLFVILKSFRLFSVSVILLLEGTTLVRIFL